MKNPILETIEGAIAAHKAEIKKYEGMLKAYHIGKVSVIEDSSAWHDSGKERERGVKLGDKRGPYKKKKGSNKKWNLSKVAKRTKSPDWKTEIPRVLKKSGEALTAREIVDDIMPGSYSKSKRVLHGRCGAMLCIYRKVGKVKHGPKKEGNLTWALA